jgi:hypothetical protein
MICEHLNPVEELIKSEGIHETYRGKPWSKVKGVWVYFDCYLSTDKLIETLALPDCVKKHEHKGTHDGSELGLVCEACDCGVMGLHPSVRKDDVKSVG